MEELLLKLRKAVDRALDAHAPSKEISIGEFPAYVIKSLETVLADADPDRATNRLSALKAMVDQAVGITKESAGAAEDLESYKITITVFEEQGLTSKPEGGSEALGAKSEVADGATLDKALETLRQEVAEIKRAISGKADQDDEEDKNKAKGKAQDEEDEAQKARGKAKGKGQDEEDEAQKAKGKAKEDEADQTKAKGGGQDGDEEDKKKAKGKAGEEDDQEKAKGKGKGDEDSADKVNKSVAWPTDMNETMPGAEAISKHGPELDWGQDPNAQSDSQ